MLRGRGSDSQADIVLSERPSGHGAWLTLSLFCATLVVRIFAVELGAVAEGPDHPVWVTGVAGISRGMSTVTARSPATSGPRRRVGEATELSLEPRSAYVLSGPARAQWQHHIPAVTQERWSMTFRTLRHAAAGTR